jgi:hypothetical protein
MVHGGKTEKRSVKNGISFLCLVPEAVVEAARLAAVRNQQRHFHIRLSPDDHFASMQRTRSGKVGFSQQGLPLAVLRAFTGP